MILQTTFQFLACAWLLFTAPMADPVEGSLFQIEFRDGTVITSEFADAKLMWTNVSDVGQMTVQPIDVARIDSLTLADQPASSQLAEILKLIGQLDSDNFYDREQAEQQLRKNGRRFRSLIAKYKTLKTTDGNYRLKRLLSSIRVSPNQKSNISLDVLTLKDGTRLSGDAGKGILQFKMADKPLDVPRNRISKITRANKNLATRPQTRQHVETKLFHDHAAFMKNRKLKLIDFENKSDGTPLRNIDKNTSFDFVDDGLVLGTEYPMGCVGISGFEVKGGDKPVGSNSVCVYKSKIRKVTRYKGVMEVTFCQPGKLNVAHGVKDFGVFLSRINHSRDVVVEAYDSMDRLIGVCESNDEPCTFCGISSTTPIARIRILSNPWVMDARQKLFETLKQSDKEADVELMSNATFRGYFSNVDEDFAADNMMFSTPVPIDSIRKDRHFFGKNGDMVVANWVRVFNKDRIEFGSPNVKLMQVGLQRANTVALKAAPKKTVQQRRNETTWMAMLRDNSVLQWEPSSFLKSTTLDRDLSRDDVIAVWPSKKKPQLPLSGDFDHGDNVLVYPGSRVSTSAVNYDKDGFRWADAKIRQEDLHAENDQKFNQRTFDLPDPAFPAKKDYGWDTTKMDQYETPTIWFQKPTSLLANQGAIKLDSGEVLVFGPDSFAELKSLDRNDVVLSFQGKEVNIPLARVISIVPPQN